VLVGIDAAISDTASLALLIESIGQGSPKWKDAICNGETCRPIYTCTKEDMIAAGDLIMCKYVMKIEGYQNVGCTNGCIQHGMLQCKFNKQNKIVSAEMVYDVMGFMQQLQVRIYIHRLAEKLFCICCCRFDDIQVLSLPVLFSELMISCI
jgi:hypothetical protein